MTRPHKLLLIGADATDAIENHYRRAFRALGHEVTLFNPMRGLKPLIHSRVLNRLTLPLHHHLVSYDLRQFFARAGRYDLVFVFKGHLFTPETIAACRKLSAGTPWVNFNPDSPFIPGPGGACSFVERAIPLYDVYFIWSHALMEPLRAHGAKRVEYLAFGYDELAHRPAEQLDPELANYLTFVGSHDAQRAAALEALADLPLRIYGNAWHKLPRGSRLRSKVVQSAIYDAELRRVVSSSLASINLLRPQNAGSHNMRTFEVPAMGGLMLTSRSEEQQALFPDREATLMFDDPAGLRQVAQELLSGALDARALRARALARCQGHSYVERARQVADACLS